MMLDNCGLTRGKGFHSTTTGGLEMKKEKKSKGQKKTEKIKTVSQDTGDTRRDDRFI